MKFLLLTTATAALFTLSLATPTPSALKRGLLDNILGDPQTEVTPNIPVDVGGVDVGGVNTDLGDVLSGNDVNVSDVVGDVVGDVNVSDLTVSELVGDVELLGQLAADLGVDVEALREALEGLGGGLEGEEEEEE